MGLSLLTRKQEFISEVQRDRGTEGLRIDGPCDLATHGAYRRATLCSSVPLFLLNESLPDAEYTRGPCPRRLPQCPPILSRAMRNSFDGDRLASPAVTGGRF
jgi:hypothetical protein